MTRSANPEKIRSLSKLQLVREHERNLAAAHKVLIEGKWRSCRDSLAEQRHIYAIAMTTIGARLSSAETVAQVDRIRDELSSTRYAMLTAQREEIEQKLELDRANKELARCERALRTADKMLEQAVAEKAQAMLRTERRELDDLNAAKRRLSA